MKCPECGAVIEATKYLDGSVLVRKDCLCEVNLEFPFKEGDIVKLTVEGGSVIITPKEDSQ